jgi:hypothetical protein
MRLPDGRLVLCEPSVYVPAPSPCFDRGRFATVALLKGMGINTRGAVSFWAALCDPRMRNFPLNLSEMLSSQRFHDVP